MSANSRAKKRPEWADSPVGSLKGERFICTEMRDAGKVVRVVNDYIEPPSVPRPVGAAASRASDESRAIQVEVEVNPNNPRTIGRNSTMSLKTLLQRYKKVSH